MVIWMNAWGKGSHDRMIEDVVRLNTGHIQIHEKGYQENETIDYAFQPPEAVSAFLENCPGISGYSKRIHAGGLISFKDDTAGTMVQAVDPSREKSVTDLHRLVLPGGRYLQDGESSRILLGEILAKNLGADVGDEIAIISQGFDGSMAAGKFIVSGLIRTGNPEYDRSLSIMNIREATALFSMGDYIHSICIRVTNIDSLETVKKGITDAVSGKNLEVLGWEKLAPEIVQFIEMDNVSIVIFDVILLVVVAFTMLITIQMSVFERIREFGVMVSIGTKPGQVVFMVLGESFFISLLGAVSGVFLGWAMSWYFKVNPLDYTDYAGELSAWGISTTVFPTDATFFNMSVSAALIFTLTLLFSILPAFKASRINPVDAIRHL
jgi:ABC-type lipoprotein release transport system permease subunit